MKRKKWLTNEDMIFFGSVIIVFIIPVVIPFLVNPSTTPIPRTVYAYIAVGIIASALTGLWQIRSVRGVLSKREEILSPVLTFYIPHAVQLALQLAINNVMLASRTRPRSGASPNLHLRANIMLIDSSDNLSIADHYYINMDSQEEIALKWAKGQGCCGWAWQDGKQLVVDPTIQPRKHQPDWRRFSTSSDHERLTKHLKSICSTPIFHPQTKKIIGVLNVDSTEPLAVTKFDSPAVYKDLQEKAVLIASLLTQEK